MIRVSEIRNPVEPGDLDGRASADTPSPRPGTDLPGLSSFVVCCTLLDISLSLDISVYRVLMMGFPILSETKIVEKR